MIWYRDLENSNTIVDWESFVKVFLSRFGPSLYDDPMKTLTRLRQVGYVEEYKVEFEVVFNRLRQLFNIFFDDIFILVVK